MKQVAKLVIIDDTDHYLLMYRSNHPRFGNDPDLPGGTLEDGEYPLLTMIREVQEEAGIEINATDVHEVYAGDDYSTHGTHYSLFTIKLDYRPTVSMSWEHSSYAWLSRQEFLDKAEHANDTYMRMVYETLK